MNGPGVIFGCYIGAISIITWREFTNPNADWPMPLPPPFRYVGASVAFGLLGLVGTVLDDRIASVIAIGLLIGLGFQTAQNKASGSSGAAPTSPRNNNGEFTLPY
jgi:hypothetical protein